MLLDSEYEQVKDKKPKGKVALISDDKRELDHQSWHS